MKTYCSDIKKACTRILFILFGLCVLASNADAQGRPVPTNFNAVVPVYQITQTGATGQQGTNMGSAFNIPIDDVNISRAVVAYLGQGFMTFPTNYYSNPPPIWESLGQQTSNQFPQIPLRPEAIDFNAFSNWTVFPDGPASNMVINALAQVGLTPTYGTPYINHPELTVIYSNIGVGVAVFSNTVPLDTDVEYKFFEPIFGFQITGPGEQAQFSFNSNGVVTRLLYSASQMKESQETVQLMSPAQASNAVTPLFPPGANITLQALYYCPSYTPPPGCPNCPPVVWHPTNIIPWYYCTATKSVTDPFNGAVSTINFNPRFTPAITNPGWVPSTVLSVQSSGSNITAGVGVTGGTPPYTFAWGGSDPAVSSNGTPAISYTAMTRVPVPAVQAAEANGMLSISWPASAVNFVLESLQDLSLNGNWSEVHNDVQNINGMNTVLLPAVQRAQFFRLRLATPTVPVNETITVTVTDANGITSTASQTIAAEAVPMMSSPDPAVDYGCESPYDPGLGSKDRGDWLAGMSGGGGGSQRFCWTGISAWPGDFIAPPSAGKLPPGPWLSGDADFNNYGVDSACIVLYIGHGNPNVITFVVYGDRQNLNSCGYVNPESLLWEPLYQVEYGGPAVYMPDTCGGADVSYSAPTYPGSWRNGGPTVNDNLFWLCFLSCEVLQEYDGSSPPAGAWQRWGPGFNCLHILTGFDSLAGAETGFPEEFANNILGSSQTIVTGWLSAAHTKNTGTAAALGPIGPDGLWNFNDHYWAHGPVGFSLPQNIIQGWWYIKWPWNAPVMF